MFAQSDKNALEARGISEQEALSQVERFKTGFPYLAVYRPATVGDGIIHLSPSEEQRLIAIWEDYISQDVDVLKFVPASGAASRMFKSLFEFLNGDSKMPQSKEVITFFEQIRRFAFYGDLGQVLNRDGYAIEALLRQGKYKLIVKYVLTEVGLNYGSSPKALVLFHDSQMGVRTAMEEHLVEGALYAKMQKNHVKVHYTVSEEHMHLFQHKIAEIRERYESLFNVKLDVSFSVQKPSTDTIAVTEGNELFYNTDGSLLFRPGGHGALIENLNDLNADVIIIKNIDNVVPDTRKDVVVYYKQVLSGKLIEIQGKIFRYLEMISDCDFSDCDLREMLNFVEQELCVYNPEVCTYETPELIDYLYEKLNRPIRICGMVRNEGDAGGGPFFAEAKDGTIGLQILESSQLDETNSQTKDLMRTSSHFNPVDIVCSTRSYTGEKFNLLEFVDEDTGFISHKSKDGRALKALERPGLWNGAMSDWNTIFVDVPYETFAPVKVVNDLLKPEHQY